MNFPEGIVYNKEKDSIQTTRVNSFFEPIPQLVRFLNGDEKSHPFKDGSNSRLASIIQVGEYFFCGHPTGIFRSSDKGKTWKLLLPSIEGKVFNLSVSGNVIYAIPRDGGC